MSLLSRFVRKKLLSMIEDEYLEHAPEVREKLVSDMKDFAGECLEWTDKKINEKLFGDE